MRRPLALLATLLVLFALTPAEARHSSPTDAREQIAGAARLAIVIFHEHRMHGSYEGSESRHCRSDAERGTWRMRTSDVAYGTLHRTAGQWHGDVSIDRDVAGSAVTHNSGTETCAGYTMTTDSVCSFTATVYGRDERGRSVAQARIVDDALVLSGPSLETFTFARDEGTCTTESSHDDTFVGSWTPRVRMTTIVEGRTLEQAYFTAKLPLDRLESTHGDTFVFALPANEILAGAYCLDLGMHTIGEGSCTATSSARVRIVPDACAPLVRSYREHLQHLRDMVRIEEGAPEPYLRVWQEEVSERIADVLGDVRGLQLWGCAEELPEDPFEAIAEKYVELKLALLRLHAEKGLSTEGKQQLVAVERQLQLLGVHDATPLPADVLAVSGPEGTMTFTARSPVSLHVYAADGAHVGWDEARGAPDVGIEGATYVGQPNGQQTITVPNGEYKVEVDELRPGTFLLEVSTNSSGATRNDSMMLSAVPGRTTATHYAVHRLDANGTPVLDTLPATLRASGGAFRYVEPRSTAIFGVAEQRAAMDEAGVGEDVGDGGAGAAEDDAGGADVPPERDADADAPAAPLVLVLALLAVAALARRSR